MVIDTSELRKIGHCLGDKALANAAADEIDRLRSEIREWFCEKCETAYPGPPQPGVMALICPVCRGACLPRHEVLMRQARNEALRWQKEAFELAEENTNLRRSLEDLSGT